MSGSAGADDAPETAPTEDTVTDAVESTDVVVDDGGADDPVSAPGVNRRSTLGLSIAIAAVVLVLDQITKRWALDALQDRDIEVFWTLQFNLAFNTGMAFSQGQGLGPVIGVLALVIVVVMLVRLGREGGTLAAVATGMIVGGALGNIMDRLFRAEDGFLSGGVVDFIDFQWFPIFNVADMGVTIGGALLILTALGSGESR